MAVAEAGGWTYLYKCLGGGGEVFAPVAVRRVSVGLDRVNGVYAGRRRRDLWVVSVGA